MGYDLFITRAETRLKSRQIPIPKCEWEAVVAMDADLEWATDVWFEQREMPKRERLSSGAVGTRLPEKQFAERIFAVVWKTHGKTVHLWYKDGAITTKNPDTQTVKKLVKLAARLDARVLGDEDEQYSADGKSISSSTPKHFIETRGLAERLSELLSRLLKIARRK